MKTVLFTVIVPSKTSLSILAASPPVLTGATKKNQEAQAVIAIRTMAMPVAQGIAREDFMGGVVVRVVTGLLLRYRSNNGIKLV